MNMEDLQLKLFFIFTISHHMEKTEANPPRASVYSFILKQNNTRVVTLEYRHGLRLPISDSVVTRKLPKKS